MSSTSWLEQILVVFFLVKVYSDARMPNGPLRHRTPGGGIHPVGYRVRTDIVITEVITVRRYDNAHYKRVKRCVFLISREIL